MEAKFALGRWNASGETLKLHGRSRRHWNFLDADRKVSCYISAELLSPATSACRFVQVNPSCKQAIYFFDYLDFMVCQLNIDKSVWGQVTMITLTLGLFTIYTWLLYIIVVYFVVPNLLTLHKMLPMRSYHYGVVVIANLLVVPRLWLNKPLCELPMETSSLLLTEFFSNTVTTFSVGIAIICYKQSFWISNWHFTGNILLLISCNVYITHLVHVQRYNNRSPPEKRTALNLENHAKALILIYMIYLFYHIFTSRLFDEDKRENSQASRSSNGTTGSVSSSVSDNAQPDRNIDLDAVDNVLVPHPQPTINTAPPSNDSRSSVGSGMSDDVQQDHNSRDLPHPRPTIEPEPLPHPEALLNAAWKAHVQALIPFFLQRKRLTYLKFLMWPLWVIVATTIPVIDDTRHLNGWCKYLICTSLLWTPVLAKMHSVPTHLCYAILVIDVVVANIILWYSHPENPPQYYRVISIIGIINGLALSHIICVEINSLVYQMLTYIDGWNLSSGMLILRGCGQCISGNWAKYSELTFIYYLITKTIISMDFLVECFFYWGLSALEHKRKAFGTIFGVAVFYLLAGIPVVVLSECFWLHQQISVTSDAVTTNVFLAIILLSTLFSVLTTQFEIRRSHGGFLIIVFCLYVLYERLTAIDIIHAYGSNHKICIYYNPNNVDWA